MRRFLQRLRARRLVVKPETAHDEQTRWLVVEETRLESAIDDLKRYGVPTMLINLALELRWDLRHQA